MHLSFEMETVKTLKTLSPLLESFPFSTFGPNATKLEKRTASHKCRVFPGGSVVKNSPAKQETRVWSLGRENHLEGEITTHSSILAWEIPWTEEPDGLQSRGLQKVQHNLATKQHTNATEFVNTELLMPVKRSRCECPWMVERFIQSILMKVKERHTCFPIKKMPVLSTLQRWTHLIHIKTLWGTYNYYLHFTHWKTELQRDPVTWLGLHCLVRAEPDFKAKQFGSGISCDSG